MSSVGAESPIADFNPRSCNSEDNVSSLIKLNYMQEKQPIFAWCGVVKGRKVGGNPLKMLSKRWC